MNQWVSIKDKYPPESEIVIVSLGGKVVLMALYTRHTCGLHLFVQWNFNDRDLKEPKFLHSVTHWQSMPDPVPIMLDGAKADKTH